MTTKRKKSKRGQRASSPEERRARLGHARLEAFIAELLFVLGRTKTTAPFPEPPPWVVEIIKQLCTTGSPLQHGQDLNKPAKEWTPADLGLARGGINSGILTLFAGTPNLVQAETRLPWLKRFRAEFAATTLTTTLRRVKKNKRKAGDALPKIATPYDYAQYAEGLSRGSVASVDKAGELKERDVTHEIYGFLWLYWPEVRPDMTIRELHLWLADSSLPPFSQKLLEKICRKIGLKFGPRGRRAKKILPRDKAR